MLTEREALIKGEAEDLEEEQVLKTTVVSETEQQSKDIMGDVHEMEIGSQEAVGEVQEA